MQTRPYRSLLFIPATRERWLRDAGRHDADAFVVDLEDAVAPAEKPAARTAAARAIPQLAALGKGVFVRINAVSTEWWLEDLRAVAVPGLTGVSVPKLDARSELDAVVHALDALEPPAGVAPGAIDVQPLLETAAGVQRAGEILRDAPRVRSYFGGAAKDGDLNRELGSVWTPGGRESLYVRSKLLVDGRAAKVPYPITGTWTALEDASGLDAFAVESRQLGYVGMYAIHPGHLVHINAAFTPSPEELARHRAIVTAYEAATGVGEGAARLGGTMIDRAMAEHAQAALAVAHELGLTEERA